MRTIKTSAVKFGINRLILLVFRWGESYTPYIWQYINGPYSNTAPAPPLNDVTSKTKL